MSSKVSFTIRRPSVDRDRSWADPNDSSDEDDVAEDELVTGFDKFGVQRQNGERKKVSQDPLVIPALKNRDWRELARKRRGGSQYVPPSATAQTGADGSVGGLGTRDTINSGPLLSGLQMRKREAHAEEQRSQESDGDVKMEPQEAEETEDQRAIRALLAETNGSVSSGPMIDIIPTPVSETDALKQDVEELPDAATLEDYNRVPVAQFGAALLRGMGWKEGTAATRKPGKGMVEPYLPAARPALLGIGAKEMEVMDDGSNRRKPNTRRPGKYMPLIRQEREGTSTPASGSGRERSRSPRRRDGTISRRNSRSPGRSDRRSERDDKPRDSGRREKSRSPRRRDGTMSRSTRSPDGRERRKEGDQQPRDSGRQEREYGRGKDRDREYDREKARDREYPRDKDRDRDYDREKRHGDSDRDRRRGDSNRDRRR